LKFLPNIRREEFPAQTLAIELYKKLELEEWKLELFWQIETQKPEKPLSKS
jgi:tryptophanase